MPTRRLMLLSMLMMVLLAAAGALRPQARPALADALPQCAPVPLGLVSWWRAEGNGTDLGTAVATATAANGATYATGHPGAAFSLDGIDDAFSLGHPTALRLTSGFTIEGWINVASLAQNHYAAILAKWTGDNSLGSTADEYWFGLQGTSSGPQLFLTVHQNDGSEPFTAGGLFSTGQWTHVAMTYDSTTGALFGYVNGVLSASIVAPGRPLLATDADMLIGGVVGLPQYQFAGQIDELSVYNTALTASQLLAITNAGVSGKCTLTVNSTGDASDNNPGDNRCRTATAGECTLRAAIEESNAFPSNNYIPFGIAGCGNLCQISGATDLPPVTHTVTIDGFTQPGASPNTAAFGSALNGTLMIKIVGINDGLVFGSGNSTVRGLIISGPLDALVLHAPTTVKGNRLSSNRLALGVDATDTVIGGTAAADRNSIYSSVTGILLDIGGNVIAGNYIGVDTDPGVASPNSSGILIDSNDNRIGGPAPGEANLIAFNGSGVKFTVPAFGSAGTGDQIRGNSIYGNIDAGIDLSGVGNLNLASPVVKFTGPAGAGGTGCAGCSIDIFSDSGSQGRIYQGSTSAAADGRWFLAALISGPNITATNTDAGNNTSAFSAALAKGDDSDGDGYADAAENVLGKSPITYCVIMRADVDGDHNVSILDLSVTASHFLQTIAPSNARYNQDNDGSISILDLSAIASHFLQNVSACP